MRAAGRTEYAPPPVTASPQQVRTRPEAGPSRFGVGDVARARPLLVEVCWLLGASLMALLSAAFVLRLSHAHLHVPIEDPIGDRMFNLGLVTSVLEDGW